MNSARELFQTLQGFKHTRQDESPQQQLFDYCSNVLGVVERLHFDYKEKRNRSNAKLEDDDKRNLAKAVSGFANSGGGVLIWGIENDSLKPKPIHEIEKFVVSLAQLAAQATDPVVPNIDVEWIRSDVEGQSSGFGLLYIPESDLPPHRVILNVSDAKNLYYIRTGDSFLPATHTQLEDMFGRRPKPILDLHYRLESRGISPNSYSIGIVLGITNSGRGIAKLPFLSLKVSKPYQLSSYGLDGNGNFGMTKLVVSSSTQERKFASTDKVIYPGIDLDVTEIYVGAIKKDEVRYIRDLVVDFTLAAEGIIAVQGRKVISSEDFIEFIAHLQTT